MVGFRVFDIGGLVAWLVWFNRQADRNDDDDDERGPGWGPDDATEPREPPPGLPDAGPWPRRLREHGDRRPLGRPQRRERRVPEPQRTKQPVR